MGGERERGLCGRKKTDLFTKTSSWKHLQDSNDDLNTQTKALTKSRAMKKPKGVISGESYAEVTEVWR